MKRITEEEIDLINRLGDNLYSKEFLEEWINRNDNVAINAPAALQAAMAKGYYHAVQRMLKLDRRDVEKKDPNNARHFR